MPSVFDRALAVAGGVIVRTFGEAMVLQPQGSAGRTGGKAGADTSRPIADFVGTVSRKPLTMQRSGEGGQGPSNVVVADAKWSLWLDAQVSSRIVMRSGDLVVRKAPARGEPARFRISSDPMPTDGGVIHFLDPV